MAEPVIIEAAINGVTSKKQNPNTPKEPAEITDDALRCFAAGAAVVHNHIDSFGMPGNSAAERYLEGWRPALAERPDALFYPTTNAGADVEASYAHIAPLAESGVMRLSLCDPGSVNLGGLGPDGLPGVRDRLRELVRRRRLPARCVRAVRARSEHRDLRAGLPALRARLVARRGACRRARW